ncbi:MAG: hypothetical protein PGN37_00635 [Mycobacterium kyogaense]|uniref:hypothetical protein n=1 Tax=Mycobacterium kyogaense TaxID=2212479 RepID=UPI002FF7EB01
MPALESLRHRIRRLVLGEVTDTVEIYEHYRRRLGDLIASHFDRLGISSDLSPYEFGVSQIALSHGLALQRAANGSLDSSLPARALAMFIRGAIAASSGPR